MNSLLPNLYLLPPGLKVTKLWQVERWGPRTHLRLPPPFPKLDGFTPAVPAVSVLSSL